MAKPHEVEELAKRVSDELNGDAPILAERLFGQSQPDAQNVGKTAYTEAVRRAYQYGTVKDRQQMARENPSAFIDAAESLGVIQAGAPGHPLTPMVGQPGHELRPSGALVPPTAPAPPASMPQPTPMLPTPEQAVAQ